MPKVGDVFRTEKDYTSTGFDPKPRWFIYLGKVSVFNNPQNIFLCTTTTQLQNYKSEPQNTLVYFFKKDGLFTEDCLAYLKSIETGFTFEKFTTYYEPVFKGNIGYNKLREIILKLKSIGISRRIMQDILDSFRLDGVPTA